MNKKETETRGEAKGMPLTIKGRRVSKDYLIEHGIIEDYFVPSKEEKSKDCTYKDTIYRQDAIEAICKACSMEEDYHRCDGYPETSTWCDELVALRALPSAQPEIIRCKDCKYNTYSKKCLQPDSFFLVPADDFYCGYAERRTDG